MKKLSVLTIFLLVSNIYGQHHAAEVAAIAESEMKSSSSLLNLAVNPNTQNYDVTYHDLRFDVNPNLQLPFIDGEVTTTFTALENMSSVTFDMDDILDATNVTMNGAPLTYTQNESELVITLPSIITTGSTASVTIKYNGFPSQDQQSFVRSTHAGAPIIWTLSEPFGARDWWPCKQDLNDKVDSINVYITAPNQFVSVSNGVQISEIVTGASKVTHFQHNYPIPAYLIAIAVSNYQIFTQQAGTAPNEFPIVNYIYPENYTQAVTDVAQTLPIMDLFEDLFETYPFADEKYGHAQFGFGGGMEHTTVSFMNNFNRGLIAHELAHQWFGDKVTCGSWRDIWLNEGFATYLSGLVIENLDGPADFVSWKQSQIDYVTSLPGGSVYLTEAEAENVGRIFSSRLSYSKGAMVVEMLRWKLGDAAFFQGLQNYLADPDLAYDYANTSDLQDHLESASGTDLDEFFDDWIYKQGYPSYDITAQNIGTGTVRIVIQQSQSHFSVPFFEMPVPIRVFGAGGQQLDVVLNNTTNNQIFDVPVPFAVTGIVFDPNRHLLSANNTSSLGTADLAISESVIFYPNPATETLNIKVPSVSAFESAAIYNSLGQLVTESKSNPITVSALANGLYFIRIKTSLGVVQRKFIKE